MGISRPEGRVKVIEPHSQLRAAIRSAARNTAGALRKSGQSPNAASVVRTWVRSLMTPPFFPLLQPRMSRSGEGCTTYAHAGLRAPRTGAEGRALEPETQRLPVNCGDDAKGHQRHGEEELQKRRIGQFAPLSAQGGG